MCRSSRNARILTEAQESVYLLKQWSLGVEPQVMAATSWQHIRTFSGDVSETLERLRRDVFAAHAFYVGDDPVLGDRSIERGGAACLQRPATLADAIARNGAEGTHSVLDITEGIAVAPAAGAVSPLAPVDAARCFGSVRPTLFEVLMTDFDAADVCEPGTGRYFMIAEPGEPALVVFVGCTGT